MDVLNALKLKQNAHFMARFKRLRADEEVPEETPDAKRTRSKWPLHTCPECKEDKHNLFGHQICDDCKDMLFADAGDNDSDSDSEMTIYVHDRWPFPIVPPCQASGEQHDSGRWLAQGTLSYMQPAPVSGFPYTIPQDDNFEYEQDPHPLEAQCHDVYEVIGSYYVYVVYEDLDSRKVVSIEQRWETDWENLLQNRWIRGSWIFTEEQIMRGRDLLFRVPFLQEQPHLGLLMVHPTANQQRFRDTVGAIADEAIGHVLYRDVLGIVLDMAYEASRTHH